MTETVADRTSETLADGGEGLLDGAIDTKTVRPMLQRLLAPATETTYALLRMVAGLMFSFHGFQTILGVLAEHQPPVGSQLWIGGLIELVCGLAMAAGALTSWAAFLASGTMAVAYVQFHWKLGG